MTTPKARGLRFHSPTLREWVFDLAAVATWKGNVTPANRGVCSANSRNVTPHFHERKKHLKKKLHKEFRRDPGRGGQGGGLDAQILYVGVGFPSRIQCIKNFEGGGSKGVLGVGSKVQFWGPISLCSCGFLGLDTSARLAFGLPARGNVAYGETREVG